MDAPTTDLTDLLAETAQRLTAERDALRAELEAALPDARCFRLLQEWGESKYDDFGFTIVEVSYDEDEDTHTWSVTGPSAEFGYYGAEGSTLAEAVDAVDERGRNRPSFADLLAAQEQEATNAD